MHEERDIKMKDKSPIDPIVLNMKFSPKIIRNNIFRIKLKDDSLQNDFFIGQKRAYKIEMPDGEQYSFIGIVIKREVFVNSFGLEYIYEIEICDKVETKKGRVLK